MKLIKVSTCLKLSVFEFPTGSYKEQNQVLRELIGNGCENYEHVMPERLYTDLQIQRHPAKVPGRCVSMLVDEEGRMKENEPNLVGSYLYGAERHGTAIMGNILFVGETWSHSGIDFCGIEESVLQTLQMQLNYLVIEIKKNREAVRI